MPRRDPESRAIYVGLILTMSPIVTVVIVERRTFGGGATLSLLLAVLGAVGLIRQLCAAPAIPRARARRSRRRGKR